MDRRKFVALGAALGATAGAGLARAAPPALTALPPGPVWFSQPSKSIEEPV